MGLGISQDMHEVIILVIALTLNNGCNCSNAHDVERQVRPTCICSRGIVLISKLRTCADECYRGLKGLLQHLLLLE